MGYREESGLLILDKSVGNALDTEENNPLAEYDLNGLPVFSICISYGPIARRRGSNTADLSCAGYYE